MIGAYCLSEPQQAQTRWPPRPEPISLPMGRTTSSTVRRCGSPTEARPTSIRSSPKWGAKSSRRFWWSAISQACSPAPRKRRWESRAARPRRSTWTTCRSGRERSRRGRPRSYHRVQHPEPRQAEAGSVRCGRIEERAEPFHQVRQGAESVRDHHFSVRHDPAQAGGDGDPDFAAESLSYRVVGQIEALLEGSRGRSPTRRG